VELMMTAWYPGHDLYVDVSVNEKKVLASQHMRVPQVYKFEADVAGGRLDLLIQSDVERTSSRAPRWEVNSLVLRRL
jgi:hypothetical protein